MESVKEDTSYSSPAYKLLEFFEKSRDRWKTKALERKRQIRRLEKRVAELEASRRHWKEKAKAQRASVVGNDKKGT
jgi:uncharacterized protein YdaU (DUF1376 family)